MPFGPYDDFADCVAKNQDRDNPEAYCGYLQDLLKDDAAMQVVPGGGELPDGYRHASSDDVPEGRACGNCLFYNESVTQETDDGAVEVFCDLWAAYVRGDHYCDRWEDAAEAETEATDTMSVMRFEIVPVVDSVALAKDKDDDYYDADGETVPADGPASEEDAPEPADTEDFHSLLVVEGIWTGDGRWIEEGSLSWRNLPLPLMALDRTTEAHMEARLIGNISRIERVGAELHGYGMFVDSDDDEVMGLQRLIRQGELRGVSVDLDAVEYEVLMDGDSPEPYQDENGDVVMVGDDWRMRITSAQLMGATVVPFPAFEEAYIEVFAALVASIQSQCEATGYVVAMQTYGDIDFTPSKAAQEEAERGLEWRREFGRGGTDVGVARARDIANGRNLSPDTVNRMLSFFARHEVNKDAEGWSPGEDGYPSNGRIAWALWGGDAGWAWARGVKRQMDARDERGSVVASGHPIAAPVVPPASWFDAPILSGPTPLTVTDDGHVFGHLATWGQCHIGFSQCITPPTSQTAYAHFRTGELLCDDGTRVAVGQITLGTGHADQQANAQAAARHYDHTGSAVADVVAGEDEHGIWVSGALRSTVPAEQIRELMAADVSGDWRRVGGNLELVGILAVNVPGFPKVRVTESDGLVASLSLRAYEGERDVSAVDRLRSERLSARIEVVAARINRTRAERIAELTNRIKQEA